MLCANPTKLTGGLEVPCGRCMNCRVNRQRFWTGRILAEAAYQPHSTFWTLTYDEDTVPRIEEGPYRGALTLRSADLRNFIKRWRKLKPANETFRYFAVGEYGDMFQRPHYHLVAFGPVLNLELESRVARIWGNGRISVSELVPERAAYCAGYTIKKMTKSDDYRLFEGQEPEFYRVSRKPPLGHDLMVDIARTAHSKSGAFLIARNEDVPKEFRIGGRRFAIGRYWVRKLREVIGDVPQEANLGKIKAEQATPEYRERLAKAKEKEEKIYRAHRRRFRG